MQDALQKKVLLISYYFEPFNGVGAKRSSYWASAFINGGSTECRVITATPQVSECHNIIFIKDPNNWMNKVIYGASWISPLKEYFKAEIEDFDFIIISGGPFGHFGIVKFLKRKFTGKVLLDFRDPFSGNIRFKSSFISEFMKREFEKWTIKNADHIITVNSCCRDILSKNTHIGKISVVENGYDERVVDNIPAARINDGRTHIAHAGKFYISSMPFVRALIGWNQKNPKKQFVIHHIGEINQDVASLNTDFFLQYGTKTYAETIRIIKTCSVGLLLTSGELLEYNTKIFDYVGCDLDIFVVTAGEIETGCIHGLTKQLDETVFWSTLKDVDQLFDKYIPARKNVVDKNKFSRKEGFRKLNNVMDTLKQPSQLYEVG